MPIRDETMPIQVGLVCDDCGHRVTQDYLVPAGQDSLAVARAHMQAHEGWQTGHTGDFCPDCATWGRRGDAEPEGDSTTMHVYPLRDLVEHDTTGDGCVCLPRADPVKREDGSVAWLLVHHSLDGREAREQADAREQEAWEDFLASRRTHKRLMWCQCGTATRPHPWEPVPLCDTYVAPPLEWELAAFQQDARDAGIIL